MFWVKTTAIGFKFMTIKADEGLDCVLERAAAVFSTFVPLSTRLTYFIRFRQWKDYALSQRCVKYEGDGRNVPGFILMISAGGTIPRQL